MLDLPGTEIYALSVRERYSIVDRGKLIHYWKIKVIAWSFDCVGKKTTLKEKADQERSLGMSSPLVIQLIIMREALVGLQKKYLFSWLFDLAKSFDSVSHLEYSISE